VPFLAALSYRIKRKEKLGEGAAKKKEKGKTLF